MLRIFSFSLIVLVSLIYFVAPAVAGSASPSVELSDATKQRIFQLLSIDCGVNGGLQRFGIAIDKLGIGISPLLIEVVKKGAPDQIRQAVAVNVGKRYNERQKWLKEKGHTLFDSATVEKLSQQTYEEYLAGVLQRTDLRYQENAIRGLGRIGKTSAISAIINAARRNAAFDVLAKNAISAINERKQ